MFSKSLLMVTAFVEAGAGIGLLAMPSWVVNLLLGEGLGSPSALVLGRVAGAAVTSLGVACWLGSKYQGGVAQRALVAGMLIYNIGVPILLLHGFIVWNLHGIALWPASALHAALAIGCAACLCKWR